PQRPTHLPDALRLFGRAVRRLAGVRSEVEQLGAMTVDELPVLRGPGPQRRPTAVEPAEDALGVKRFGRQPALAPRGAKVAAVPPRGAVEAEEGHERAGRIDGAHRLRDDLARGHAGTR